MAHEGTTQLVRTPSLSNPSINPSQPTSGRRVALDLNVPCSDVQIAPIAQTAETWSDGRLVCPTSSLSIQELSRPSSSPAAQQSSPRLSLAVRPSHSEVPAFLQPTQPQALQRMKELSCGVSMDGAKSVDAAKASLKITVNIKTSNHEAKQTPATCKQKASKPASAAAARAGPRMLRAVAGLRVQSKPDKAPAAMPATSAMVASDAKDLEPFTVRSPMSFLNYIWGKTVGEGGSDTGISASAANAALLHPSEKVERRTALQQQEILHRMMNLPVDITGRSQPPSPLVLDLGKHGRERGGRVRVETVRDGYTNQRASSGACFRDVTISMEMEPVSHKRPRSPGQDGRAMKRLHTPFANCSVAELQTQHTAPPASKPHNLSAVGSVDSASLLQLQTFLGMRRNTTSANVGDTLSCLSAPSVLRGTHPLHAGHVVGSSEHGSIKGLRPPTTSRWVDDAIERTAVADATERALHPTRTQAVASGLQDLLMSHMQAHSQGQQAGVDRAKRGPRHLPESPDTTYQPDASKTQEGVQAEPSSKKLLDRLDVGSADFLQQLKERLFRDQRADLQTKQAGQGHSAAERAAHPDRRTPPEAHKHPSTRALQGVESLDHLAPGRRLLDLLHRVQSASRPVSEGHLSSLQPHLSANSVGTGGCGAATELVSVEPTRPAGVDGSIRSVTTTASALGRSLTQAAATPDLNLEDGHQVHRAGGKLCGMGSPGEMETMRPRGHDSQGRAEQMQASQPTDMYAADGRRFIDLNSEKKSPPDPASAEWPFPPGDNLSDAAKHVLRQMLDVGHMAGLSDDRRERGNKWSNIQDLLRGALLEVATRKGARAGSVSPVNEVTEVIRNLPGMPIRRQQTEKDTNVPSMHLQAPPSDASTWRSSDSARHSSHPTRPLPNKGIDASRTSPQLPRPDASTWRATDPARQLRGTGTSSASPKLLPSDASAWPPEDPSWRLSDKGTSSSRAALHHMHSDINTWQSALLVAQLSDKDAKDPHSQLYQLHSDASTRQSSHPPTQMSGRDGRAQHAGPHQLHSDASAHPSTRSLPTRITDKHKSVSHRRLQQLTSVASVRQSPRVSMQMPIGDGMGSQAALGHLYSDLSTGQSPVLHFDDDSKVPASRLHRSHSDSGTRLSPEQTRQNELMAAESSWPQHPNLLNSLFAAQSPQQTPSIITAEFATREMSGANAKQSMAAVHQMLLAGKKLTPIRTRPGKPPHSGGLPTLKVEVLEPDFRGQAEDTDQHGHMSEMDTQTHGSSPGAKLPMLRATEDAFEIARGFVLAMNALKVPQSIQSKVFASLSAMTPSRRTSSYKELSAACAVHDHPAVQHLLAKITVQKLTQLQSYDASGMQTE